MDRVSIGAFALLMLSAAFVSAQEPSSESANPTNAGVYVGGNFGVLGGSSLWSPYDFVDGSGSQFGGLAIGYARRTHRGAVFGGEADLSFGAAPVHPTGISSETPELFGTVRGRLGYGPKHWFAYGTGGLAWTRNQFTAAQTSGDQPAPISVFRQRIGWTLGTGLERAIDARWSVDGEYLYTRFGAGDLAEITPRLSTHQLRIGLHYALGDDLGSTTELPSIAPLDANAWNAHAQTTLVGQYAAPFHAPYRGANSLDSNIARETWDVTFYVGRRLWSGAALRINPEIDQGYGLSNT